MEPALILLGLLGAVALVIWIVDGRRHRDEASPPTPDEASSPGSSGAATGSRDGCVDDACVLRTECPAEQLAAAACSKAPLYFEDEELDAYRGRAANEYSAQEIDEFREVLYTLRRTEVLQWHHSLQQRQVALPDELRDELLMLATE